MIDIQGIACADQRVHACTQVYGRCCIIVPSIITDLIVDYCMCNICCSHASWLQWSPWHPQFWQQNEHGEREHGEAMPTEPLLPQDHTYKCRSSVSGVLQHSGQRIMDTEHGCYFCCSVLCVWQFQWLIWQKCSMPSPSVSANMSFIVIADTLYAFHGTSGMYCQVLGTLCIIYRHV
jgi:hypothetical protein